jgi:HAE1 family hydrophobic/amphiphilic exporter-1
VSTAGGLFGGIVRRPVAVTMTFLAAVVFGGVSLLRLPLSLLPDVGFPTLTVRTAWEGAAPQEVETTVSRPIEGALATLDGLVRMTSRSRAEQSDVVLTLDWGADLAAAGQAVRERLQTTPLPDDADRPLLLRYDPGAAPLARLALSMSTPDATSEPEDALALLRDVAEREVTRTLEALPGVAAVRVRGGVEREVRVDLNPTWCEARQVTPEQVRDALAAANVNLAGGSIFEGDTEFLVRTLAELPETEQLAAVQVRRADGSTVALSELGTVHEVARQRTTLTRLDGQEAVEIEVFPEAGANLVAVAGAVRAVVEAPRSEVDEGERASRDATAKTLADRLPVGMTLALLEDGSTFVELAIDNLVESVTLGGLLSILVLWLFLRDLRATFIIGVTLPISALMGFAPLYMTGTSLNVMSLGGLALGLSMLVDNAVVVLENIQRHRDDGVGIADAAARGTSEVAVAMSASTLTSIAVFGPILFVEGMAGELFRDLAVAVIGAQLAGLTTGVVLVPMLAGLTWQGPSTDFEVPAALPRPWQAFVGELAEHRRAASASAWRHLLWPWVWVRASLVGGLAVAGWLGGGAVRVGLRVGRGSGGALRWLGVPANRVGDAFQEGFSSLSRRYEALLDAGLARPGRLLGVGLVALLLAGLGATQLGAEVLPEVHQGRLTATLALPVGAPLARTSEVAARAEAIAGAHDEVLHVLATVGTDGRADAAEDEGEHTARLRLVLAEGGDMAAREARVLEDLREAFTELPDTRVVFRRPALLDVETPVELVVFSDDLDRLAQLGEAAAAALEADGAFRDVASSLVPGNPEVRIAYDRERLARLGLDTRTIATRVRDRLQGAVATELHRGDQRLDLRVQLDPAAVDAREELARLNVHPSLRPLVPLEAVATLEEGVGPSEIRRVDQQRAVVVRAALAGFDLSDAAMRLTAVAERLPLTGTEAWALGGQVRDLDDSLGQMLFALWLAVFLVDVILAITFEDLVQPLVLLLSIPLGLVGVVAGLWISGTALSVVAGLGVVVLAGVVVNNAIVLVDAIHQLRDEGHAPEDAVRIAARTRLRPILVTTSTAVLGLLPLLVGQGAGAELQRPMAVAIVGGLTSSTLLTLGLLPALMLAVERARLRPAPVVLAEDAAP